MVPGTRTNALRRVRQYEATSNAELRRRVASALVEAKIRNSRRVLQRLSASRGESAATAQKNASEALLRLRKSVRRGCFDLDSLRGMEGMAAACYFKRLADFFPEEAPFRERSRRPPLDAANALLSWTYSIVLGEIDACVRLHGLDPGIGFLHALEFSMPSLALDLLEPLRAPLCDSLALALLNRSILRKEHFRVSEEDGGTYLSDEGKPLFFMAYERAMTRKFVCRRGEPRVDFRRVLERQVCSVVRILEGGADADFFVMP